MDQACWISLLDIVSYMMRCISTSPCVLYNSSIPPYGDNSNCLDRPEDLCNPSVWLRKPTKTYYNLLDVVPNDVSEDNANYRCTIIPAPRIGEQTKEVWNVKIEYSGCAKDDLEIAGWAYDKPSAGKMLGEGVVDHIVPIEEANNLKLGIKWQIHTDAGTYHSEYVILEEYSTESEDVWY
jgi:hypothetical protein